MNNECTADAAWKAFDKGDFKTAEQLWQALLHQPQEYSLHNRYLHNYAQVLIAQERNLEAQHLLQELYTRTGQARCLHQLGCLARRTGQFKKALRLFLTEKEHLDLNDNLALAINAYELGRAAQQREKAKALEYAQCSLTHALRAQDGTCEGLAYRLVGDLLLELNRREEAVFAYVSAQEAFTRVHDHQALEELQLLLAVLEEMKLSWSEIPTNPVKGRSVLQGAVGL